MVPIILNINFSLFTSFIIILSMFPPFHHCSYCSSPSYIIFNIIQTLMGCTLNPKKNHSKPKDALIWDVSKVNISSWDVSPKKGD
jgi:hypothetical protein